MSGECDDCGEHATDCQCYRKLKIDFDFIVSVIALIPCRRDEGYNSAAIKAYEWIISRYNQLKFDGIDQLEAAHQSRSEWLKNYMNEWISIQDRFPPFRVAQHIVTDGKIVTICKWVNWPPYTWILNSGMKDITHWMPLPEPPKLLQDFGPYPNEGVK